MKCTTSMLTGGFFVLLGLAICAVIPSQITVLAIYDEELSPRFFPYLCAILMTLFGFVTLLKGRSETQGCSLSPESREGVQKILVILACTAVAFLLMAVLGMVVTLALLVVAQCYALGVRSRKLLCMVGLGWAVSVYVVFELIFAFALPKGLF